MKDIVTFETAVRLKEAGFPRPLPQAGMFGYNDAGHLFVRTHDGHTSNNRYGSVLLNGGNDNITLSKNDFKFVVFAPTATDILRELSSDCVLGTKKLGGWICGSWRLISSDHMKFFVAGMHDENPAEAAASAWLKLQEEK